MTTSTNLSKQWANHKKSLREELSNNIAFYLFLFFISLFILIPPFFRGLYFRENYIPSVIYISGIYILYILYKLIKKENKFISSYIDVAILLLPVTYLVSFVFAVNSKDAFDTVLKYASYFMAYRMVADLCNSEKKSRLVLEVILFSIFVSTISAILTIGGVLGLKGVFLDNRFHGVYQYPNTTAAVIGAGLMLVFGFITEGRTRLANLYYQMVLTTLMASLILTLSRGAIAVFALVYSFYFLIIPAQKRLKLLYSLLSTIIVILPLVVSFYNGITGFRFIFYFIATIAFSLLVQYIANVFETRYIRSERKHSYKTIAYSILILSIVVISVAIGYKQPITYRLAHEENEAASWKVQVLNVEGLSPNTSYRISFDVKSNKMSDYSYLVTVQNKEAGKDEVKLGTVNGSAGEKFEPISMEFKTLDNIATVEILLYNHDEDSYTIYKNIKVTDAAGKTIKKFTEFKFIPKVITNRLTDISLGTNNLSERLVFDRDGMQIFKEYFLFGAGGGGWKNTYSEYQSYNYSTTETHNFYVQSLIEAGLIGAVLICFVLLSIIYGLYTIIRTDRNSFIIYAYMATLVLLIHSYFDFDLSLSAIALLLWILIGVIYSHGNKGLKFPESKYIIGIMVILSVGVFVASSSIYSGMLTGKEASETIKIDTNKSIGLYEKAMKKDKFSATYRMDYAQIMNAMYANTNDRVFLEKMDKAINETIKYEGYKFEYVNVIIKLMLRNGEYKEASDLADKLFKHRPMDPNAYSLSLITNYSIAKEYFSSGSHVEAIPYLRSMVAATEKMELSKKRSLKPIVVEDKVTDLVKLANNWLDIAEKKAESKK